MAIAKKILIVFAILLMGQSCFSQAYNQKNIDSLKIVLKDTKADSTKIKIWIKISRQFSEMNLLDSSFYYVQLSLNLSKKINDSTRLASSYFALANYYKTTRRYKLALENFKIVENIDKARKNDFGFFRTKMAINTLFLEIGEYEKFYAQFDELMALAKTLKDTPTIFTLYTNIVYGYLNEKKFDSGLAYAQKHYDLSTDLKNDDELHISKFELARYIFESNSKDLIKGINYATEAKDYFKGNYDLYFAQSCDILAKLCIKANDLTKAKKALDEMSTSLDTLIPNLDYIAYLESRYKIDSASGNYKSSFTWLQKLYKVSESYVNNTDIVRIKDLETSYEIAEIKSINSNLENEKLLAEKKALKQRIILGSIILSSLGLLGFLLYKRRQQNKQRAIEADKLKVQNELKFLKTQLDPHFIQNTFQVMANKLQIEKPEDGIKVLQMVSNYLRGVLNQSDKQSVSLEDEIEFIEQYLKLTTTLAKEPFTYNISIDEDVDTFGLNLPPMLLQPIVENSIKHGFKNGTLKNKHITIQIKNIKENRCEILLGDNGVGNSCESTQSTTNKGTMLTQKMLELFFADNKIKPSVHSSYNEDFSYKTIITIPIKL